MTTFWVAFKDVCALVMPMEDTEALFEAQGKWTPVEEKVHKVCSTAQLRQRMFGFVQDRLVADKLQEVMEDFDRTLAALPKYTQEVYKQEAGDCKQKLGEDPNIDKVPAKRVVSINDRGIMASVQVGSIFEEIECRWAAAVKARATQAGLLDPMLFEADLVDENARHHYLELGEDMRVMEEASLARAAANQFVNPLRLRSQARS
uniref:Uncharacterized protein n=1 Tax=Alexandrium monilatum TaxID=311494 RepID=A0A7S4Q0T4_9DINO